MKLYFPTDLPAEVGNTVKGVLTLLHGYTNCGEDWLQMTSAARYAADNGLVLIIPDCDNSFYQNMVYGGAYYSFMTEELPLLLRTIFRLSPPRSQNYIAGLSMGGYGALYLGLSRPDIWAGCASFSGAVDLALMLRDPSVPGVRETFAPIFGDGLALPPASNLHYLAGQAAQLFDKGDQGGPPLPEQTGHQEPAGHREEKGDGDAGQNVGQKVVGLPVQGQKRAGMDGDDQQGGGDAEAVKAAERLGFHPASLHRVSTTPPSLVSQRWQGTSAGRVRVSAAQAGR